MLGKSPSAVDPAPQNQQPVRRVFKRRLILIVAGILVLFSGFGALALIQWRGNSSYDYGKLENYKLTGSAAGQAISFNKPSKLATDNSSTNLPNQAAFIDFANKHTLAYVTVYSSAIADSDYQQLLKVTPQALNNPKTTDYWIYSGIPKDFVASNTLSTAKISYSLAKSFTNQYIRTNAWQFNFSVTNPSNKATGQGTLVYALGKKTYYFFLIYADKDYWPTGYTIWNQLLASIQIDQ